MARKNLVTPAVRVLREANIGFVEHHYEYEAGSGAAGGAAQLALDPHRVIKTLILETSGGRPLCVLMHGDREVSLKQLARAIGVKSVAMAVSQRATAHSGYKVGGTSPFGLRKPLPLYCEASIAELDSIVVNGGKRGFLIEVAVADLIAILEPELVDVATTR
ncbi:MAG: aminoacyl-tRNA deacylase [bacterium]|nr:aminoacyl-tRNA deacylase [bacterium]